MTSAPNPKLRRQVIAIYKGVSRQRSASPSSPSRCFHLNLRKPTNVIELLHLGKDYPLGLSYFRPRLYRAFKANAQLRSDEDIRKGIERAEFVKKGITLELSYPLNHLAQCLNANAKLTYLSSEIEAL
jgi:hypothetical protein